jgi:EAL domain-containing protein (putative c-di-GMP-specific phosphodiesterase class I)
MIPPLVFIAVAEKTDLIRDLGDWVIRRAFTDASAWPDLVTSINLSPIQLRSPGFADRVRELVAELAVNPAMFEFEITETVLLHDTPAVSPQLLALKEMGFRIALDDFGSGYAGIAYLRQIPFDRLKIDQSFVQDLSMRPGAGGVVKSIIGLALAMRLEITAEGIEEAEQHRFLKDAGWTQMQGFLFHRPKSRDELVQLRAKSRQLRMSA